MNPFINFSLYYSVPNQHFLSAMGRSAKELGVRVFQSVTSIVGRRLSPSDTE